MFQYISKDWKLYRFLFPWEQNSGSAVKNPPSVQEMRVWYLGQEDPLKEGAATHSSILAWKIPWTEEPDQLQITGSQRIRHNGSDWACANRIELNWKSKNNNFRKWPNIWLLNNMILYIPWIKEEIKVKLGRKWNQTIPEFVRYD